MMGMTLLLERLDDDLRREFGMSLTEYEVMVRLSERPGRAMRMAQLADAMAHSRSRVTHTVARMEAAGFITRGTTPEDGRGVVATMTPQGYELLLVKAAPLPRGERAPQPGRPRPRNDRPRRGRAGLQQRRRPPRHPAPGVGDPGTQ